MIIRPDEIQELKASLAKCLEISLSNQHKLNLIMKLVYVVIAAIVGSIIKACV